MSPRLHPQCGSGQPGEAGIQSKGRLSRTNGQVSARDSWTLAPTCYPSLLFLCFPGNNHYSSFEILTRLHPWQEVSLCCFSHLTPSSSARFYHICSKYHPSVDGHSLTLPYGVIALSVCDYPSHCVNICWGNKFKRRRNDDCEGRWEMAEQENDLQD